MNNYKNLKIAVLGMGYVGLPLAVALSKKYNVIGFDINSKRIDELSNFTDTTLEVTTIDLETATNLSFTSDADILYDYNIYIVAVPTPIDNSKKPDLTSLCFASETVGKALNKNDVVIYESTVYPGATEEVCVPILEEFSQLEFNKDFFVGYSPERINPGDKENTIENIVKVTSGSSDETAKMVDKIYSSIIPAGTFMAPSIKVAEAAKVIENTQRDINIALINELAIIFDKLNISTHDVLEAANTKWNFLPFQPGLVGGHCIGVDPYYLTHKAQSVGYYPDLILAGRRLNDNMANYAASKLIKAMIKNDISITGAKILIMGLTFKEDCPDIRNTKVIKLIDELKSYGVNIDVMDPWCSSVEVKDAFNIDLINNPNVLTYDAIVIAVGHSYFKEMGLSLLKGLGKDNHLVFDLKSIFDRNSVDLQL